MTMNGYITLVNGIAAHKYGDDFNLTMSACLRICV